ncbi:MAG: group II intron reverse transcriptase/maturase [Halanaerobiales bacterium]|nr:group II intron reverse transcriptase/maturase [Halanaerobiales bacterium]
MATNLARISVISKQYPKERFTSLYHLLNKEMFLHCHQELSYGKSPGVDGVTKEEYEENLVENIENLVDRLKRHAYKPLPARRTYIPKGNGKKRPLGIPAYEDKLVQMGLKKILEAIYEPYFLDFSYGFRPKRSQHDALRELDRIIKRQNIKYVIDADIRGFFDNMDHDWLMKFVSHKIADPNIQRLIVRFLKAGIVEEKLVKPTEKGAPQGSVVSPVLANIYLHYVLDLWFEGQLKKFFKKKIKMVRFADDFICCFEDEREAKAFYKTLPKRLNRFNLEMAKEKSKIIMFGRNAEKIRKDRGLGRPETFDFLGFTHYCGKCRHGRFRVKRKTSKKKFKAKVKAFKEWIRKVRNQYTIHEIFQKVRSKLTGHYNYYGITDNWNMISQFRLKVMELLFKWLNRRSQRKSFDIDKFKLFLKKNSLPRPRIYVNVLG